MSCSVAILMMLGFVFSVQAATGPRMCKEKGKSYNAGEEIHSMPGECYKKVCSSEGYWYALACPVGQGLTGTDYSKPYPDCCP